MADDEIMIEDDAIALEDTDDTAVEVGGLSKIMPCIMERCQRSEDYRYQDEESWLRAYRNYRGLYGPDVQVTEAEKSRIFIKVTKTKTLAAYGQIADVLFAGNKFPISIEPTELPEGVAKDVNFDPKEPSQLREQDVEESLDNPYGFMGDGKELPRGATAQSLQDKLVPLADKLEKLKVLKKVVGKLLQR